MDKRELSSLLKYYMVFIALSIIPILVANILLTGKANEGVLWIISAVIMLLFVFVGMLYRPKYLKKKEEKKKNNIDPFK